MKRSGFLLALVVGVAVAMAWPEAQGAAPAAAQGGAPAAGAAQGGGRRGAGGGGPRGGGAAMAKGTLTPMKADERGWGWQVKASIDPKTPRPFYNVAKELLFQDKQVTSFTVSSFNPELYCEVAKHYDYVWFELQHSTVSWDEVRRMLLTCPGPHAAPMIRMPDALESSMQKATDLGVLGIIIPTVDDALEARDAARFARYPPVGRRSSGGGSFNQVLSPILKGQNYRQTINDNMLVTVMIETLEGVANANEIAATFGVDVVILGNNDLSSFSGWPQNDDRYMDALIKVHDAALRAGKYYGNAGAQFLTGSVVSEDTRFVQNGPARDGWVNTAGRGGRGQGNEEPLIGAPAGGRQGGGRQGRGAPQGQGNEEPLIGVPGAPAR